MPQFRWTATGRQDFALVVRWYRHNREPVVAIRVAAAIRATIRRAAAQPLLYPWAGSIYPELADQPQTIRRILTHPAHHIIFYRYDATAAQITILHIRGSGQLPPMLDERATA